MIYFDNAATTMLKPPEVAEAVAAAINSFGGVGRGAHDAALSADMVVYRARAQISDLFNGPGAKRVAFAGNVTEALNEVISGLLHAGDHTITTAASHNSVLRPLFRKQDDEEVEVSILPVELDASIDYEAFDALFRGNTKLAVVTHASNLTGDVYDIARMARIAHAHGALICVDAAQTAGVVPIDMVRDGIDIVAFTGHKSLLGPQGTGGLCLADPVDIPSFVVGGSGTHSYDRVHPQFYPERLEAGTLNGHGIAGLSAGLDFIEKTGIERIHAHELALAERFERGVSMLPSVRVYGGHGGIGRTGIVSLNVGDIDSAAVSDVLSHTYGICTRPGAHCASLMHEAMGTSEQGEVRFSFGYFNTEEEVDAGIAAVREIAEQVEG
ncbi:aminotransferase class V-fold PLP-dependent enzyme [Curtanaerobium respiraculi]|uniref:aminotransferase class V-fold PLP-dependent enzyme n=1 Tax=Curtanaerobium respiraculi TaxID=2949669 RepID=UPI0024B388F5|nr:aminotransferase class V-fold PLP-dependent enzyme [Curtanaerobium respiraculi]